MRAAPLLETPRRHPWVVRIGLAFALALALTYGPYRLVGGPERRIDKLERQLAETRAAVTETEGENARLRRRVRALKNDPSAVEDIAREELGMVGEGELVIELEASGGRDPEAK